jgi:5-methylthioadenosine/S-adenosylhomocysteine deaminase
LNRRPCPGIAQYSREEPNGGETPSNSSGCTLLHHNGFDNDGAEGARRAHIAIRTYLSTGIRLAFSPGVRNESKLAMGGEGFIETLPPDLKAEARPFVFFDKEVVADSYFRLFDELYEAYNNTETRILPY